VSALEGESALAVTAAAPWAERPTRALTSVLSSARGVAIAVFLVYGLWIAIYFASGHDARVLIALDRKAVLRGHGSSVIRYDPTFPYSGPGYAYDGGWWYLIALDPAHAASYVDFPGYRYTKILYPLTARTLALGVANLIPYTLILVNWLALALGTLFLALWLKRRGVHPWLALLYPTYYGTFISFQRDLTEPMAYALVLAAIYLYDFGGRRRTLGASACFALAILTRDKSAIFAVLYGLALLFMPGNEERWYLRPVRNFRAAALFLAIAGAPILAYEAFLRVWLGAAGTPLNEQATPLQGILGHGVPTSSLGIEAVAVFVPATICAGLAAWALCRRIWRVEIFLLLLVIELTVVTLNPLYFVDARGVTRVGIAIVIAALLCLPALDEISGRRRWWLAACAVCWTSITAVWAVISLFLAVS
jgi:hypothetical protein